MTAGFDSVSAHASCAPSASLRYVQTHPGTIKFRTVVPPLVVAKRCRLFSSPGKSSIPGAWKPLVA